MHGDANGIRLGTQEITRWGMQPADMAAIARLMARVLLDGEDATIVRSDVTAFRKDFRTVHFVR
jgi:glycine hydroxymethyltransferase